MMDKKMIALSFKGARKYIQGPDIFNCLIDELCVKKGAGSISDVDFVIHNMTDRNLVLLCDSDVSLEPEMVTVATIKALFEGGTEHYRLVETDITPDERNGYDESLVTDYCELDKQSRSIMLAQDTSGFSALEIIVSMNKALHFDLLTKPDNTSWVFCRWQAPTWPVFRDLSGARIIIKQVLGSKLTKSEVVINNQHIGFIYFSAKESS